MKNYKLLKTLLVLIGILIGSVSTQLWAVDVEKNARIYFDNSTSNWSYSYIYFVINETNGYKLNHIDRSKIYYHKRSADTWGGYSGIRLFADNDDWGTNDVNTKSYQNMYDYGENMSNWYGSGNGYGFGSTGFHFISLDKAGSKTSQATVTVTYNSSKPTRISTAKIRTRTSYDGSYTTVSSGTWPATVNMTGTYWDSDGASGSNTAETNSGASGTYTNMYTGLVEMSIKAGTLSNQYTFDGWATSEAASPSTSNATYSYYITTATTVYAYFTKKWTITFNKNGHGSTTPSTQYVAEGGKVSSVSDLSATGYTFGGWYTDQGCTAGNEWNFSSNTVSNDVTLYAKWTINSHDITYSPALPVDGTHHFAWDTKPSSANYGASVTFSITPSSGYEMAAGYPRVNDGSAVTVTDNGDNSYTFTMRDADPTVTVSMAPSAITVNYGYIGNGSLTAKQNDVSIGASGSTVAYNSTVNFTATPDAGHEVEGWYTNAGCTTGKHDAGSTTYNPTATSTLNVYAKFILSTYNITYNLNSGTNNPGNPATYHYTDETITLQDPTRDGYYFGGWYTSSTFTGGTEKTSIPNHSTGNVTLYAKWIGFSNITVAPSTSHTGAKSDTIVVGDAITITSTVLNAPSPSQVCPTLYKKEEGVWVEQDITFGGTASALTIAAKPLSGNPLPAGEYKVSLTLRDGSTCGATEVITSEKTFRIGDQGWYIYGGAFWGWPSDAAKKEGMKSMPATNGDGVQLLFLPTATVGQYYYGPFQFKNENVKDYRYFRIYNKIDHKDNCAQADGNFWISSSNDEDHKITIKTGDLELSNSFYANGLTGSDYYLYLEDGKLWVSTTRPVLAPRVQFYVSADAGTTKYWSNEVTLVDGAARKISFYHPGGTVTLTTERFLLGVGWTSDAALVALTLDNATRITTAITAANKGVYVADLTWDASNDHVDISNVKKYDGDFYVRTNHSPGGYDNYKQSGNLFTYSDYSFKQDDDPYSHYFMKWVEGTNDDGRNVKFDVANEYNSSLSKNRAGYAEDDYANGYGNLKANANVRFMYNYETNALSRAYLSGSAFENDYFLVLKGCPDSAFYLYKTYTSELVNTHHTTNGTTDWAFFGDTKNWVYQVDVYAKPGTRIKLTAQFKDKNNANATQYFKGADGSGSFAKEYTESLIGGTGSTPYHMRVVYDFKTNRLISAWTPSGTITGHITDVDVMLERYKQGGATQIKFNSGSDDVTAKTIIGAIRFDYNDMYGNVGSWSASTRPLLKYLISFPFDVKVSDLFGLNSGYGEAYVIQKYDGAERASKGFFRGDGTTTFWKNMEPEETMEKNIGYCLILDNDYFNGTVGHIWDDKTSGTSVYLYFPSTGTVGTISGVTTKTIRVPAHTCTINRTFVQDDKTLNHQITDSHWNLMGVPTFDNTEGIDDIFLAEDTEGQNFKYYYGWNSSNNKFSIANATDTTFKSMHCYMVQYTGDVTFTGSKPEAGVAARKTPLKENYTMELQVLDNNEELLNRTYVELRENACDTFELNEDVYLAPNNKAAEIYTFAGNYDVAANVLSINNHTVEVGVTVKTAGTYTFSMPNNFSGTVTLVDTYTQTRTDLATGNYIVNLPNGVCNDRFLLEIDIRKVTTAIDGVEGGSLKDGKAHKFIKNDMLYILKDGVVYDARGNRVK